jgi:hypothetical protein
MWNSGEIVPRKKGVKKKRMRTRTRMNGFIDDEAEEYSESE